MRHRVKGTILDRKKGPRELMLRNLASSVLIYEKVQTTKAKAKAAQLLVEKAVTLAKKGGLSEHKELIAMLPQRNAVKKSIEVLGDRFKERTGGYTRIVKIGPRQGDGAEMVQIELV